MAIGEELGDWGVVAINATNRGNIARDVGDTKDAVRWYERASTAARKSGSPASEAFASLRLAELWVKEAPDKAEFFAAHAVALLQGTAASEKLASALRIRARAQETQGKFAAEPVWSPRPSRGIPDEAAGLWALDKAISLLSKAEGVNGAVRLLAKWSLVSRLRM